MKSYDREDWDIFISHASEDKAQAVGPLARKLQKLGLRVWFDDFEIEIGDSLSRKIDEGLAKSRVGLVILSHAFFAKKWPEYELRGLTARLIAGSTRILPVWHNVSHADVAAFSPTLADAKAGSTQPSLDALAIQIVRAVRPALAEAILRKMDHERLISLSEKQDIAISQIERGPIQHPTLPRKLVNRIELIANALRDQFDRSLAEWVDGFQRDAHPSQEIQIWEDIAAQYRRAVDKNVLSEDERRIIITVLLMASTTDVEGAVDKLVNEFGSRANDIAQSFVVDHSAFSVPTDEDRERISAMPVDLEDHEGPASLIDSKYLKQLVASEIRKG